MYIFFKFLVVFLYLEISVLLFSFFVELYRILAYNYAMHSGRSKIYKRRILKEITSISKKDTNEIFDCNFFLLLIFFINFFF